MPARRVAGAPLDFAALRASSEVPGDFSPAVLHAAEEAAQSPRLPDADATDIPFVTVDPAGSRDLDQAVHIDKRPDGGYLVNYAIADVAAFLEPDSAIDQEANRRGETLYFPDARVPLHPAVLSEGAASLLPGQTRPAVLWQIQLDANAEVEAVVVRRSRVRSREQSDYVRLDAALRSGTAPEAVRLLPEVGALRQQVARQRHAINLDLPQQEVVRDDSGGWTIQFRSPLPVEAYNAEISLLTGMCAARLMLDHGIGLLRTVPPADERVLRSLHKAAPLLNVGWSPGEPVGDVLARLDRADPKHAAFIDQAASLMRGAAYVAFDGSPPGFSEHAGIGAPYAHVTAPLRRLIDRYGNEICLALYAGVAVPDWVRSRMPELPRTMSSADQRAHVVDRAVVDMTEAWLLRDRIGQQFAAIVLDADERAATVAIEDPAIRARCEGESLVAGTAIHVRLITADVDTRTVRFAAV
ncbi:MAG: RNB domain-containing ribonuclease [Actinobacteria bacterium]|nr:RNB domain-containing ribonuclease [Actinomycetota bacterium]